MCNRQAESVTVDVSAFLTLHDMHVMDCHRYTALVGVHGGCSSFNAVHSRAVAHLDNWRASENV